VPVRGREWRRTGAGGLVRRVSAGCAVGPVLLQPLLARGAVEVPGGRSRGRAVMVGAGKAGARMH